VKEEKKGTKRVHAKRSTTERKKGGGCREGKRHDRGLREVAAWPIITESNQEIKEKQGSRSRINLHAGVEETSRGGDAREEVLRKRNFQVHHLG